MSPLTFDLNSIGGVAHLDVRVRGRLEYQTCPQVSPARKFSPRRLPFQIRLRLVFESVVGTTNHRHPPETGPVGPGSLEKS